MKKQIKTLFNKKCYLLGKDHQGINYWLEEPSWDCGWYWGFGYIETYTNNNCPEKSRDISSHSHFDSMFMNNNENARDSFKKFFKETTLTDNEIWELCDYMKTFYTLKSVAELFGRGYSHYSERAKIESLKSEEQTNLVNKSWLPEVFKRIDNLLSPEKI